MNIGAPTSRFPIPTLAKKRKDGAASAGSESRVQGEPAQIEGVRKSATTEGAPFFRVLCERVGTSTPDETDVQPFSTAFHKKISKNCDEQPLPRIPGSTN